VEAKMTLYKKILTQRNQQNMTQEQLAKQLNVSPQTISEWEAGESLPDAANIVSLSEIFNVSLDYLLKNAPATPQDEWWHVPTMRKSTENEAEIKKKWDLAYPLAMIVYLIIGFGWGMWHPGWLVFTAAWAFEELLDTAKLKKRPIEFYGLASVVFFVLGFWYDLWHFAWVAYVLAFIIEGATTSFDDI